MNSKFAYTSEDDKCYGIIGMVISLNVFDNESMLSEVSLDKEDSITFTPDFFFNGNPRFSAKIAWNEMIRQYQLLTAMVMGNIMCRYRIEQDLKITEQTLKDIHQLIDDDGREACQLEDDEIDMIFNKTLRYLNGVYDNRQVHSIASGLFDTLKRRRTLTGDEVIDELQYLRRR